MHFSWFKIQSVRIQPGISINIEMFECIIIREHALLFLGRRRRAQMEDYEDPAELINSPTPKPEPLEHHPIPFDVNMHGHRYRRTPCNPQYVLFLLDTSGSIWRSRFCELTCELANLVQWFCSPVHIAVMTFDSFFHQEFCFDDYNNDCPGRESVKAAIKNIGYRGYNTYTGEAVECAFREMLNENCGFPRNYDCLSIVTITDGQSNGQRDVCSVLDGYKSDYGFTSYSIGIGDVNQTELECIATNPTPTHLLQYPNFERFKRELDLLDLFFHGGTVMGVDVPPSGFTCINAIDSNPVGTENCRPGPRDTC